MHRLISILILILIILTPACVSKTEPSQPVTPEKNATPPEEKEEKPIANITEEKEEEKKIDFESTKTKFEELVPQGYIEKRELEKTEILYGLKYPELPKEYIEGVVFSYPPMRMKVELPLEKPYEVELKQTKIYVLKFETTEDSSEYFAEILDMLKKRDFSLINKVLHKNGKELEVYHKISPSGTYVGTLFIRGVFIFEVKPGVKEMKEAGEYIKLNMDYLFS